MIGLPHHLSRWARELAIFPPDIALVVGGLAQRISPLVGSWQSPRSAEGEPDGYDGIARRGSYERLLISEWMLLEEAPEEFIRRVVAGEHGFLQATHRRATAARSTMVLFDSGPEQLGAPRIVHLAALIVLAQRANNAGSSFSWGILQDSSLDVRQSVTRAGVLDLMDGRSSKRASTKALTPWLATASIGAASEWWLVGPEWLTQEAQACGAATLSVSDVLDLGAPQKVKVSSFCPRPQFSRQATLTIPPGQIAVRLLRDPFSLATPTRQKSPAANAMTGGVFFSADGRKVHLRGEGGSLITFSIPNSPREPARPPSVFRPPEGHVIVAVGRVPGVGAYAQKRRIVVATQSGRQELWIHILSKRGVSARHTRFHSCSDTGYELPPVSDSDELRPLAVVGERLFCFANADGNVIELSDGRFGIRAHGQNAGSRALLKELLFVDEDDDGTCRVMWAGAARSSGLSIAPTQLVLPPGTRLPQVFFGPGSLAGLVAYPESPRTWKMIEYGHAAQVHVPLGYSVIGVNQYSRDPSNPERRRPCLVVLDDSRTKVETVGSDHRETVLTTPSPIRMARASDAGYHIAYVLDTGELGVYSLHWHAMVALFASRCEG